jgi:hypothetical protein
VVVSVMLHDTPSNRRNDRVFVIHKWQRFLFSGAALSICGT